MNIGDTGQLNWKFGFIYLTVNVNIARLFRPNVIVQLGHFFWSFFSSCQRRIHSGQSGSANPLVYLFLYARYCLITIECWAAPPNCATSRLLLLPPFLGGKFILFQQKYVRCFRHFSNVVDTPRRSFRCFVVQLTPESGEIIFFNYFRRDELVLMDESISSVIRSTNECCVGRWSATRGFLTRPTEKSPWTGG